MSYYLKRIEESEREQRRVKVLQMLKDRPVILAMAIRDIGTCALLIERHKYDPFLLLELIQKGTVQ